MYVARCDIKIVNTTEVRKMLEEYKKNLENRSFHSTMLTSNGWAINVLDRCIKKRWNKHCCLTSLTILYRIGMTP